MDGSTSSSATSSCTSSFWCVLWERLQPVIASQTPEGLLRSEAVHLTWKTDFFVQQHIHIGEKPPCPQSAGNHSPSTRRSTLGRNSTHPQNMGNSSSRTWSFTRRSTLGRSSAPDCTRDFICKINFIVHQRMHNTIPLCSLRQELHQHVTAGPTPEGPLRSEAVHLLGVRKSFTQKANFLVHHRREALPMLRVRKMV